MNKNHFSVFIDCPVGPETNTYSLPSHLVSLTSEPYNYYISYLSLEEGMVEFDVPKQLVPSFDKTKSGDTLIAQYSNVEKDIPATISVVLSLDITTGDVTVTGYGFKQLELMTELPESIDETHYKNMTFAVTLKNKEVVDSCLIEKEEVVMNKEDAYDVSGEDEGK